MYRTILVPLDGSHRAEAIIPHVDNLARLYHACVIFLQVFELPHMINLPRVPQGGYSALPHVTVQEMQVEVSAAETYLKACVETMRYKGITAEYRVAFGPVAATILRVAEEENVDLIAMASHGCSGLQGVYYGSVAAGVLQRVDRPLLIVRSQNHN